MNLEGKTINLVEFTSLHLGNPNYFNWLRDVSVINTIGRVDYLINLSLNEVQSYINGLLASSDNCVFEIETVDGRFIGTLKIGHIEWRTGCADIGIMIGDKDYWGKGVAKESISLACKYAFDFLCLRKLSSGCAAQNVAMVKAFESIGFVIEGQIRKKLLMSGKFDDHLLFGLFKDELKSSI